MHKIKTSYGVRSQFTSDQWSSFTRQQKRDARQDYRNQKNASGGQNANGVSATGVQLASQAVSTLSNTISSDNENKSTSYRDTISDAAISSGNPYAMAIGAAAKIIDKIGDATGYHTDDIDKEAANEAGIDGTSRGLNNVLNALPGTGIIWRAFSNKETDSVNQLTDEGANISASYSGEFNKINNAKKLSNKHFVFGLGRKEANDYINDVNETVDKVNMLGREASLVKNSDYAANLQQQDIARYAASNYSDYAIGRKGMKFMTRRELHELIAKQEKAKKLQKGGIIGTDTNILPEGALHARLNHLDEKNEDLEDVTRKGIPVLDSEGNQVAEIENNEIIFRIELTNAIENLMKDGSEEAMIEAGKLIASELIENTQDNTGQIEENNGN
jgi:hypothetical protein